MIKSPIEDDDTQSKYLRPIDGDFHSKYRQDMLRAIEARELARQQAAISVFETFCEYDFDNPKISYELDKDSGRGRFFDREGEELDRKIYSLLNRHTIAYFLDLVFADVQSTQQSERALKRHAETRSMKLDVFQWLEENMHNYKSMDKAAEAVIRQQPIAFRTARDWVGEWKKLRSTSKA